MDVQVHLLAIGNVEIVFMNQPFFDMRSWFLSVCQAPIGRSCMHSSAMCRLH